MGDLLHPPRGTCLADTEPKGQPTLQHLSRIGLRLPDCRACMTAPVVPFVPPSRIRQRPAWKWGRLMAKVNLMPQPLTCAPVMRESDLAAADGLRPAVSARSSYRLVSACGD